MKERHIFIWIGRKNLPLVSCDLGHVRICLVTAVILWNRDNGQHDLDVRRLHSNLCLASHITFHDHCLVTGSSVLLDNDYPSLKLRLSTFASSDLAFQLEGVHCILRICDVPNIVRPTSDSKLFGG